MMRVIFLARMSHVIQMMTIIQTAKGAERALSMEVVK
jgi:hypothetical protein